MATVIGPTTHASGFVLSLAAMELTGDLLTPKLKNAGKDENFKMICSECKEPHKVEQFYKCEKGHGPFKQGDLTARAREEGDKLVRVSAEEIKDAKKSILPDNAVDINIHRKSDVEGTVFSAGTSYIFKPSGSSKLYGLLVDLVSKRDDLVFMGVANIRKTDKLIKISVDLNRQLVLTELVWPEDMATFEEPEYQYKPSLLDQAELLVEKTVADFELGDYAKASRQRIAELVAEKIKNPDKPAPKKKVAVQSEEDTLEATLSALIAAA